MSRDNVKAKFKLAGRKSNMKVVKRMQLDISVLNSDCGILDVI
jgi:hypothetical protein